ncbi:MAG: oligosaccharide flippase family protein [Candidatus Korobacteraceae bacterium]
MTDRLAQLRDRGAANAATLTVPDSPGVPALGARFFGYLSADGLNYALGFLIYGWLVRVLTNQQYGQLSVATSLYQALMMVAALGLDLTGPRLLAIAGDDPMDFARKALRLRLAVAVLVCGPLQVGGALIAWHRGQALLAMVILASFSMVLARALDLTYLAVALRLPAPLAKTRALGLFAYLLMLILCTPLVRQHLWLVPLLNAVGVTLGRVQLARLLRRHSPASHHTLQMRSWQIVTQGIKAGAGQLLLLVMQTGDVVLLVRYVSTDAVGQYAMVSRLYLLGIATLGAMFNTFLPEVVHVVHDAIKLRHVFRICVLANLALGLLGSLAFYGIGAPLSELVAHRPLPAVHAVSQIFALVFLLMAAANPFLGMLPSLHRGSEYFIGIASATVLLLGLDLTFMPRYGVVGAAYGQATATAWLALFSGVVYLRHIRVLHAESLESAAREMTSSNSHVC